MTWADLSDDELLARLTNRGLDKRTARQLVDSRDQPDTAHAIDRYLT